MQIKVPTLLLDEDKCLKNIQLMTEKASLHQINFRPHFKTHQSAEIGSWFKNLGVASITVSSVQMAVYFADAGWDDILIAFPVNLLEIDNINKLAQKIKLHLLLESVESTKFLIGKLKFPSGIYLKVDTGYHRTGLSHEDDENIMEILSLIKKSPNLKLTGILTHAGDTYSSKSKAGILNTHKQSKQQLEVLKKRILINFPDCLVSIGDTPGCSLATDFSGVDEIRPGNFVFYDIMQYFLGTCNYSQIAVAVACPVVAKHKSRNEIVIYGGAIHLSKEAVFDENNRKVYGLVVKLQNGKWGKPIPNTFISNLSQEHGIIKTTSEIFEQIGIGETIGILPVHSCLTANLLPHYSKGDNRKIIKFRFNG